MAEPVPTPKSRAAAAAAMLVCDGMIVGLGSGSTAAILVRSLGERIQQEGLKITAISTSDETTRLAGSLGILVQELDSVSALDINLDGADEIDGRFRMIKGRGGAAAARENRRLCLESPRDHDHVGKTC